jgi:hypothetical protein
MSDLSICFTIKLDCRTCLLSCSALDEREQREAEPARLARELFTGSTVVFRATKQATPRIETYRPCTTEEQKEQLQVENTTIHATIDCSTCVLSNTLPRTQA